MKIIGWDIGIKNLSYCILDTENINNYSEYFEFENNKYYIVDWQDLDIIPNIEYSCDEIILNSRIIPKSCEHETKKKNGEFKYCNTKPKFVGWYNNNFKNYKYYCKRHKKHISEDYKNNENKLILIEINNGKQLCCYEKCLTNAVYINNDNKFYGYCKKHLNQLIKSGDLTITEVKKILKEKKAGKNNLTLLCEALYKKLNEYPQILNVNKVIFENQPVLKNPTMKSMQIFLYGYYIMNGYMNNEKNINELSCYNANKKIEMQYFVKEDDLELINKNIRNIKSKYSRTKKKCIAITEYFLINNYINVNISDNYTSIISIFSNKKKRDDLSDSLLMTLHYLEKKRIIYLKNHAL